MLPRYLTRLDPEYVRDAARRVPYQRLETDLFPSVEVWVRRDDLIDPLISGNKAYKLLFNLLSAREQGVEQIITCGGAWSNHILATAAAGRRFGFRTAGIIRGERPARLSATLQDSERLGMELCFISRDLYRRRAEESFLDELGLTPAANIFVPEGGANLYGARGAEFLGRVIDETAPAVFDQVWLACGTGVTLAGIQAGLGELPVIGVPVLKAGSTIIEQAAGWLELLNSQARLRPLREGYDCGGYARMTARLGKFILDFELQTGIPVDPVYTAKVVYGLQAELQAGQVAEGARILLLHSGGLQGRRGLMVPKK